jgi:hypothetical protein
MDYFNYIERLEKSCLMIHSFLHAMLIKHKCPSNNLLYREVLKTHNNYGYLYIQCQIVFENITTLIKAIQIEILI